MLTVLALLLLGHALADYPLQGDFLARAKNHAVPIPGVPWVHGLLWHSVIHGGAVGLVTGSLLLGSLETAAHMLIDYGKCGGWYARPHRLIVQWFAPTDCTRKHFEEEAARRAFHTDQALHVACKVLWVALYAAGVA